MSETYRPKLSLEETRKFYDELAAQKRLEAAYSLDDIDENAVDTVESANDDERFIVDSETARDLRKQLVEGGADPLEVGSMNNIEIVRVAESKGLWSEFSSDEIAAARKLLVENNLSALNVGNMTDDQVIQSADHMGLLSSLSEEAAPTDSTVASPSVDSESDAVKTDAVSAEEAEETSVGPEASDEDMAARENESLEEYEARHGVTPDTADDEPVIVDELDLEGDGAETLSADDLEEIDIDEESEAVSTKRSGRLKNILRNPAAALSAEASAWAATRRERNSGRERSRTARIARGLGAAALLIGGGALLLKHGHNPLADIGGGDPTPGSGGGTAAGDILYGHSGGSVPLPSSPELVHVNPGDGEIKVVQHILHNHGIDVSTADAQRIGENAGVHDILSGDSSYAHSGSSLDRVGKTGDFKVKDGVVSKLLKSAKELRSN